MMKQFAIGADIGGSHITCQLYDLESRELVEGTRARLAVDSHSSGESIIEVWTEAIRKSASGYDFNVLAGIGFAMPGPFDYHNGIAWFKGVGKYEALYGIDIRKEIHERFLVSEDFPVRFLNDASCFAIGESILGEASEYERFLAVTLGTGFGTTFILDHLPVAGIYGIPDDGFLYHIPFGDSIADDYFSTRWFQREYSLRLGKSIEGVKELAELAGIEGPEREIFRKFGRNLGTFLAPWLKSFEAGCLVAGGNISTSNVLFAGELDETLLKEGVKVKIIFSSLQEEAALSGSASLCVPDFYSRLVKDH
ncbi:MAG: ROK family protein [Bacteroidetes bacterium]|nr:ROK family protein [Bacteroidota bacterium]